MTAANEVAADARKVVVVGATGNIGTSVVRSLAERAEIGSIVGVARRTPEWTAPKTQWVRADVAEDDLTDALRGADAVIHLAWLFQPSHDPVVTWRTNVLGSIRVFEAAAAAGVPALIHTSSIGAYSPGPKDRPVAEDWPTNGWPGAAYTREKAYVERVLDAFERDHPYLRVVRFRPGFVLKREAASEQRRLFAGPLLPNGLVRRGAVPVFPDIPGLVFQTVHTDDLADAYRLAVLADVRGPFNLAADPVVDPMLLAEILGARVVRVPARAARAAVAAAWHLHLVPASPELFDAVLRMPVMDTARARTELGWSPRHDSTSAIKEFLAGLREGAGLPTPPLSEPVEGGRPAEVLTGVGQKP
ncbi:NAD-dependent epimerase/dehydratase family protein [Frankia sp. CNm7]|nr:NAD-dependent epimerase/dehydratase family protein [Frankia nepalensis]MBL7497106.1 NAD-dependent epimerase/dehydratase family protein [Frankia nepalensis]MBL7510778.1 NAD-dependent epimerase/dehydratase family protein [Frankia nepalensis]MBL7521554.1 NAD-dependent epimerase/dehydratase family protein [Frankia nepalensis]